MWRRSFTSNFVLKSVDAGETWVPLATWDFRGARFCRIAVTPGASDRLFAATNHGLYRSLDGGVRWSCERLIARRPSRPYPSKVGRFRLAQDNAINDFHALHEGMILI